MFDRLVLLAKLMHLFDAKKDVFCASVYGRARSVRYAFGWRVRHGSPKLRYEFCMEVGLNPFTAAFRAVARVHHAADRGFSEAQAVMIE